MSGANEYERRAKERSCALLAGREAAGQQGTGEAAPRLAGRRCPHCKGHGVWKIADMPGYYADCTYCAGTGERSSPAGERSGPANK